MENEMEKVRRLKVMLFKEVCALQGTSNALLIEE